MTDSKGESQKVEADFLQSIIDKEASKITTHDKPTLLQAKALLKTLLKESNLSESFLDLGYSILDRH